jgi:hypothetical protein
MGKNMESINWVNVIWVIWVVVIIEGVILATQIMKGKEK